MSKAVQKSSAKVEALARVREMLRNPDRVKEIAAALPRSIGAERFLRIALTTIAREPKLAETPAALWSALVQAAQLGLEVDGVLGRAYLVPYRNKHTGRHEAVLIPGYLGLLELAYRTGAVESIAAHAVYRPDKFRYELGLCPTLYHEPALDPEYERPDADVVWVYAVLVPKDSGAARFVVWSRAQIERHKRRFARGTDDPASPWNASWLAMAKKTVLRDLLKYARLSPEIDSFVGREEIAERTGIVAPDPVSIAAEAMSGGIAETSDALEKLVGKGDREKIEAPKEERGREPDRPEARQAEPEPAAKARGSNRKVVSETVEIEEPAEEETGDPGLLDF